MACPQRFLYGLRCALMLLWLLASVPAARAAAPHGQVVALRFTSDHGLLCRNTTDLLTAGDRYPCTAWARIPAINAPISHTVGTKSFVRATVSLALPALPAGMPCLLEGKSAEPALCFRQELVSSGEPLQAIDVTAGQPLGLAVRKIEQPIRWTLTMQPGTAHQRRIDLGITGPHTVYAILGRPQGVEEARGVPTDVRMDLAVRAVAAVQAKAGLTTAEPWLLWELMRENVEAYLPTRHYPREQAWRVPESRQLQPKGASCISIVEYVGLVGRMVGMEGEITTTAFHARLPNGKQAQRGGLGDPPVKKRAANGETWQLFLVDHHNSRAGQVGGVGGMNYYEAVLEFRYRGATYFYPGGTDRVYDHGDKVLSIFRTLAWAAYDWTIEEWVVREVVETYSQPGDKPILSVPLPR
ncbi:MAG: hypothetical protein JNM56_31805 [Planctomycetia bacterium]|nr:hypothetical protein [Planctomycetia bacterium]